MKENKTTNHEYICLLVARIDSKRGSRLLQKGGDGRRVAFSLGVEVKKGKSERKESQEAGRGTEHTNVGTL